MTYFLLLEDTDVSLAWAQHLRGLRKRAKLSREALATKSGVPASTLKKFEQTGQISLRQFLLLWQTLDDLARLYALVQPQPEPDRMPTSIEEVLQDEF